MEQLLERVKKIVSFKGEIKKRRKCPANMKVAADGKTCVSKTSEFKQTQRKANIKRQKTLKTKQSTKRRATFKRLLGTAKRKRMGIRDS